MPLKRLNHLPPKRRCHIVRNKVFFTQIRDRYPRHASQPVLRTHDKGQAVVINSNRFESFWIQLERSHPNLKGPQAQLLLNPACQHPMHRHTNLWVLPSKLIHRLKQVHTGVLVRSKLQSPSRQALQLIQCTRCLTPQRQQTLRVVPQQLSRRRQRPIPCRPVEKRLPN